MIDPKSLGAGVHEDLSREVIQKTRSKLKFNENFLVVDVFIF